jgi:hypothetical protein
MEPILHAKITDIATCSKTFTSFWMYDGDFKKYSILLVPTQHTKLSMIKNSLLTFYPSYHKGDCPPFLSLKTLNSLSPITGTPVMLLPISLAHDPIPSSLYWKVSLVGAVSLESS